MALQDLATKKGFFGKPWGTLGILNTTVATRFGEKNLNIETRRVAGCSAFLV